MSCDFIPQCIQNQAVSFKESLKTAAVGIAVDAIKICYGEKLAENIPDLIMKVVGIAGVAFGFYLITLNLTAFGALPYLISELGAFRVISTIMSIGFTFFSTDAITISENLKKMNLTVVLDYGNDSLATNDEKYDKFNKSANTGFFTNTYLAATVKAIKNIFLKVINAFRPSATADVTRGTAGQNRFVLKMVVLSLVLVISQLYFRTYEPF